MPSERKADNWTRNSDGISNSNNFYAERIPAMTAIMLLNVWFPPAGPAIDREFMHHIKSTTAVRKSGRQALFPEAASHYVLDHFIQISPNSD